jgi:hypothetical protein
MLALQAPEKRVARILRKIAAQETDPKVLRHAKFGLARYAS